MAAVGDIYRITFNAYNTNQLGLVVRHYKVLSVGGAGLNDAQIATAFMDGFKASYQAVMSNTAQLLGATAQKILPLPPLVVGVSASAPVNGTIVADVLPFQTCGVLSFKTANAGRRYRGRAYIPFPAESDNDPSGNPSGAYIARLILLGAIFGADFTAAIAGDNVVFDPVIHSKKFGLQTPITNVIARPFWGTQRRRGQFGRANTKSPF